MTDPHDTTPLDPQGSAPLDNEQTSSPDQTLRQEAWAQQQQAAKEYRHEANNYGYPGVWTANSTPFPSNGPIPGTFAGRPVNQANFYQPVYKRGPKLSMIIWGLILLCLGLFNIARLLLPMTWFTENFSIIMISAFLALLGLILIISAIASAFNRGKKAAAPIQATVTGTMPSAPSEPQPVPPVMRQGESLQGKREQ